jgi:phenylacetate-CoA ligase
MPLIRYRMGDYAAWAENQSCLCGNPHRIITNLEGRVDDYLLTLDGRKIGRLSTAVKRSQTIHSSQIVQDRPGHAYLLVRPGTGYQSSHASAVKEDIIERIGHFAIDVVEVPEIPRTPRGKAALVIRLDERPYMVQHYETILSAQR